MVDHLDGDLTGLRLAVGLKLEAVGVEEESTVRYQTLIATTPARWLPEFPDGSADSPAPATTRCGFCSTPPR